MITSLLLALLCAGCCAPTQQPCDHSPGLLGHYLEQAQLADESIAFGDWDLPTHITLTPQSFWWPEEVKTEPPSLEFVLVLPPKKPLRIGEHELPAPRRPYYIATTEFPLSYFAIVAGSPVSVTATSMAENMRYLDVLSDWADGLERRSASSWPLNESPRTYITSPARPFLITRMEEIPQVCYLTSVGSGLVIRPPTLAEWIWACRAGTDQADWWGNSWEDRPPDISGRARSTFDPRPIHLVGEGVPNPWGLINLYGNVAEVCDPTPEERTALRRAGIMKMAELIDYSKGNRIDALKVASGIDGTGYICLGGDVGTLDMRMEQMCSELAALAPLQLRTIESDDHVGLRLVIEIPSLPELSR